MEGTAWRRAQVQSVRSRRGDGGPCESNGQSKDPLSGPTGLQGACPLHLGRSELSRASGVRDQREREHPRTAQMQGAEEPRDESSLQPQAGAGQQHTKQAPPTPFSDRADTLWYR